MSKPDRTDTTADTGAGASVRNAFTVDLEEFFQVTAFETRVAREDWDGLSGRVVASTELLLEVLAEHQVRATFFTLGWIADRYPGLVRSVAAAGHEIASHGWWHRRISRCTREEFRSEVVDSRRILEDVCGVRVYGHRAPSFSMVPGSEWAFDVLVEAGYTYDSSVFPVHRGDYGYPGADPEPHYVKRAAGRILELPLTTTTIAGWRLPAAGGGYFRHLPYALTRHAFRERDRSGRPGVFYIHPWELDPEQPRLDVSLISRVRHYGGLKRTLPRLHRLLSEFRFAAVTDIFPEVTGDAAPRSASGAV